MRLSHIAVVYILMGVIVMGAGVIPAEEVGLVDEFVDINTNQDGEIESVGEDAPQKDVDTFYGPIVNALNTITGGALLAIRGTLDTFIAYIAWPITLMVYIGAPPRLTALGSVLIASFTFGILRVFRRGI